MWKSAISWKLALVFAAGFLALSVWSFIDGTWPAAWGMLALTLAWVVFGVFQLRRERQAAESSSSSSSGLS